MEMLKECVDRRQKETEEAYTRLNESMDRTRLAREVYENIEHTRSFTDGELRIFNLSVVVRSNNHTVIINQEWMHHDSVYKKLVQVGEQGGSGKYPPVTNLDKKRQEIMRKMRNRKITETEYNHILETPVEQLIDEFSRETGPGFFSRLYKTVFG